MLVCRLGTVAAVAVDEGVANNRMHSVNDWCKNFMGECSQYFVVIAMRCIVFIT